MGLSQQDVRNFAQERFDEANTASEVIRFSNRTAGTLLAESYMTKSARSLHDMPEFKELVASHGKSAWGVMLCVDIRGSTNREVDIGPKQTYLTVHTYLPTMIHLVSNWDGQVTGLRGDGLIAAIGLHLNETDCGNEITSEQATQAVSNAVACGKAMLETIEIVNSVLTDGGVRGGLQVGVGIDVSDIVVTRIGLLSDTELTAYGPSVSKCCKYNGERNQICMSLAAREMYPEKKVGKTSFRVSKFRNAVIVDLAGHRVLQQSFQQFGHPNEYP